MPDPSPAAAALRDAVARYTAGRPGDDGLLPTAIPALSFFRGDHLTTPVHAVYEPSLCLVVQGAKRVSLGDVALDYGAMQFLVVSVELPFAGQVVRATPAEPYLALLHRIDPGLMVEIAEAVGPRTAGPCTAGPAAAGPSVFVGDVTDAVAECALRLVRLLGTPEAIPVLYPSVVRELYYWLLTGPDGPALRRLALPDGHVQRVARAVHVLRTEFDRPVRVERLAEAAHMSPSAFHAHFKAATAMTPVQYQKRLRLFEARRLLAAGGLSAADAGYRVGYESPSQFSREYARLFGAPPGRDGARARAVAA